MEKNFNTTLGRLATARVMTDEQKRLAEMERQNQERDEAMVTAWLDTLTADELQLLVHWPRCEYLITADHQALEKKAMAAGLRGPWFAYTGRGAL